MPENIKIPFPRHEFIPPLNDLAPPQRLLRLIDTHRKLKKKYQESYRVVIEAIDAFQSESYPGLAGLSAAQRETINKYLLDARDEIARGFTQSIKLYETTINELAPGTFPQGKAPYGSFDLAYWVEEGSDWLADLFRDVAAVAYDLGLEPLGDALEWTADVVEWAGDAVSDLLREDPPEPQEPQEPSKPPKPQEPPKPHY